MSLACWLSNPVRDHFVNMLEQELDRFATASAGFCHSISFHGQ
jgi:hypothetical protein